MKRTCGSRPPLLTFTQCSSLVGVLSLILASNVLAFTPHPVTGRLLLQLRDGVEAQGFGAGAAAAARKTGQPGLDALGSRFGVTSFEPQFAGARAPGNKPGAAHDMSRFVIVQ